MKIRYRYVKYVESTSLIVSILGKVNFRLLGAEGKLMMTRKLLILLKLHATDMSIL